MRPLRLLLAFALAGLVVAALGGGAAPAAAAPPWSDPETVPDSLGFGYPYDVAIAPDGRVIVTFVRDGVRVAVRRPDGHWEPTRKLSSGGYAIDAPSLAVTGRGEAIVVWTQAGSTAGPITGPYRILASSLQRGARRWSRPVVLGRAGHFSLADPRLVADARGDAAVAWRGLRRYASHRNTEAVNVAFKRPGHRFGRAHALAESGGRHSVYYHQIALDAPGAAYVVWTATPGPVNRLAVRGPRGRWSATQTVSTAPASIPQLALARDGGAVIAWHQADADSEGEGIQVGSLWARVRSPAGVLGPARLISDVPIHDVQLQSLSDGSVLLAWAVSDIVEPPRPDWQGLHYAVRPPGGDVGPEQSVPGLNAGAPSYAPPARLAALDDGTAVLVWGGNQISATLRPPGGTFGAPEVISTTGDFPVIASRGSHAVVVFYAGGESSLRLSERRG